MLKKYILQVVKSMFVTFALIFSAGIFGYFGAASELLWSPAFFSALSIFATATVPILFAVRLFSFVTRRPKLDFYFSVPIKSHTLCLTHIFLAVALSFISLLPYFAGIAQFYNIALVAKWCIAPVFSVAAVTSFCLIAAKSVSNAIFLSLEMFLTLPILVSAFISRLNRELPALYYEFDILISFNDLISEFVSPTLYNAVMLLMFCVFTALSVRGFKKIGKNSKPSKILTALQISLFSVVGYYMFEELFYIIGGDVLITLGIISFTAFVITAAVKFKTARGILLSVPVYTAVAGLLYAVMYLPVMYGNYCENAKLSPNDVVSAKIEIASDYKLEKIDGILSIDSVNTLLNATDENETQFGVIALYKTKGALPVYKKVYLSVDERDSIVKFEMTADQILPNPKIVKEFFMEHELKNIPSVQTLFYDEFKKLSDSDKYAALLDEDTKYLKLGQNSFFVYIIYFNGEYDDSVSLRVNPLKMPYLFDAMNDCIDKTFKTDVNVFISRLEQNNDLDNYKICGYKFLRQQSENNISILKEALNRNIQTTFNDLGAEQFSKGALWQLTLGDSKTLRYVYLMPNEVDSLMSGFVKIIA